MLANKGIKQLDWFSYLFYGLFGVIATPIVAISTLVATVYGLVKHRSRSNLWWIIASAVISVFAFMITGIIYYHVWDFLSHGTR